MIAVETMTKIRFVSNKVNDQIPYSSVNAALLTHTVRSSSSCNSETDNAVWLCGSNTHKNSSSSLLLSTTWREGEGDKEKVVKTKVQSLTDVGGSDTVGLWVV